MCLDTFLLARLKKPDMRGPATMPTPNPIEIVDMCMPWLVLSDTSNNIHFTEAASPLDNPVRNLVNIASQSCIANPNVILHRATKASETSVTTLLPFLSANHPQKKLPKTLPANMEEAIRPA
eukprot:GHVT01036988.1.p2 GENE.GHVT01036988.1~~GHVT01036988.1.p2  ORF type:complete len:122 (+),score=0.26 GHVT01036988.1:123-488(+)